MAGARRLRLDGPVAVFELGEEPRPDECAADGFPETEAEPGQETGPTRPSS
jgi:hypothetical protein